MGAARNDTSDELLTALREMEQDRQHRERQLRSLLDAAQAGVSSLALREVLQRVLGAVSDLFAASGAAIWRLDDGGVLRRFGSAGLSERFVRAAANSEWENGIAELVVRSGQPLAVADLRAELRLQAPATLASEGFGSMLSVPLFSRGQPSGTLSVYRRDPHFFDEGEVRLLTGLANLAAASIENALLHARTERALAQASAQRELLHTIVETARDGILALDEEGRILLFSAGCERLTGWTAAQAEGRLAAEVLSSEPGLPCPADCPVKPLIPPRGQQSSYSELRLSLGGDAFRWVGASLARVPGRRTGSVRAVMVLRDITAAKEMDELKSNLLSTISHELRTPLTSIRALSELMVEHDFDGAETRQVAATINRESERLNRLVDNVLDAARIEAGRLPTHPQPTELAPLIAEAVAVIEGQAGRRFHLDLPDDLPMVLTDPDRLRQIVDNLLSNAVKYSASQTQVWIKGRQQKTAVRVSIADQGRGIPPDQLQLIFQRFHRVRAGEGPGGSGLGLYITRNLVELMGGEITATSRPGRGSLFTFTVPLARQETA